MNEITKQQESSLTLLERLQVKRKAGALLLDTSSSMNIEVEPGKKRIDALRDIVSTVTGNFRVFWFNDGFGECTKDSIPNPTGYTNLAGLLEHLKSLGIKNALLITDGEITDKPRTRISVQGITLRAMYVGSGERPPFLDEICSGMATTDDLKQTAQLTEKIQLLLNAGRDDDNSNPRKGGAIQL